MKQVVKLLFGTGLSLVILYAALITSLRAHDQHTKLVLSRLIAKEVPPHASVGLVEAFMTKQTASYALDDQQAFEYTGFVPQSGLDKLLMNRKVRIVLKMNPLTKQFSAAEIQIFYTFL
jgi:hypothetical protein